MDTIWRTQIRDSYHGSQYWENTSDYYCCMCDKMGTPKSLLMNLGSSMEINLKEKIK